MPGQLRPTPAVRHVAVVPEKAASRLDLAALGQVATRLPLGTATLVNGRTITRTRLKNGDQLQIGGTRFLFQEKKPSTLA